MTSPSFSHLLLQLNKPLFTVLDKETQSSSAKDKRPSHPSASTHVVVEMHKEAQQAAGGPTSLGVTSEEGAHPQLSSGMDEGTQNYSLDHIFAGTNTSVLVDKTKFAENGLKTVHTDLGTNEESRSDEISKKIKLEDLSNFMQDTRSAFLTPDSPQDESIIVSDESEEKQTEDMKTLMLPLMMDLKTLQFHILHLLNQFATSMENASSKVTYKNVPLAGQANASPAEREKNTNDDDNANLKKQPTTITPPTTSF
ncbi:hypothetical protein Tco_0905812 [Tanacetum coccineum]